MRVELYEDVDNYLRTIEGQFVTEGCLNKHPSMSGTLRARMVDWMIEVLTNFKCDDLSFFLAVNLMDRFFLGTSNELKVQDLHIIGVTSMFLASKYEDIYPLKMKTVHQKIGHSKLEIEEIKRLELEMIKVIHYRIHTPTVLDFLK